MRCVSFCTSIFNLGLDNSITKQSNLYTWSERTVQPSSSRQCNSNVLLSHLCSLHSPLIVFRLQEIYLKTRIQSTHKPNDCKDEKLGGGWPPTNLNTWQMSMINHPSNWPSWFTHPNHYISFSFIHMFIIQKERILVVITSFVMISSSDDYI